MKKHISILLVAILALTMGLTGCGESEDSVAADEIKLYDYDLTQYVELGQYSGFVVPPVEEASVSQDDVDAEIEQRIAAATTEEVVTEGVVDEEDLINIDYKGYMDGEEFAGGSSDPANGGVELLIGSHMFIPGFEEGLVGQKVGDTVTLDLNFPDPYENNPDLSGKAVTFDITINSKTLQHKPEYNLDFVKENSDCKSIEEYEESIHDELLELAQADAETQWESSIWDQVYYNAEIIQYPEAEMQTARDEYTQYYENMAAQYGMTVDDILNAQGATKEEFDSACEYYAQSVVANEMILFAIADKEGLRITDEEFSDGLQGLIEDAGFKTDEEFKAQYGSYYADYVGLTNIVVTLTMDKVLTFVKDSLTISEDAEFVVPEDEMIPEADDSEEASNEADSEKEADEE